MFLTRKLAAGVLVLLLSVPFFASPAAVAAGRSDVQLYVDNRTNQSYSLVVCAQDKLLKTYYADFGDRSEAAREFLPKKTAVNAQTAEVYYLHLPVNLAYPPVSVRLVNFGFTLAGNDSDCNLPFAHSLNDVATQKIAVFLVLDERNVWATRATGTLKLSNYTDSPYLIVVCSEYTGGYFLYEHTGFIRAGEKNREYNFVQDVAVYAVPEELAQQGGSCAQMTAQADQVIYYNYRPDTVTTRRIANFAPAQPGPEVEEPVAAQEIKVITPSGRSLDVDKKTIEVETSHREVTVRATRSTPAPGQLGLIRTGGFDN